jgi:hypothetical protein
MKQQSKANKQSRYASKALKSDLHHLVDCAKHNPLFADVQQKQSQQAKPMSNKSR